ncbi:hypothetical protein BDK51DRAFT_30301 [Blyttiomyces helicus]|uniref:Uncharacterized protein n=1 Tax=Blyttiomyces helicus TaxID=388810 RepID=A0A4V1IQ47_9FUNG|nr:hypothetical protein BDK51DRAFT_30301 [Blyttiomyces helicus]|eukprot:RKO85297.1 hypothetical protein BDK51DRAFT_30301 [Blyttiomyces helicus]
MPSPPADSPTDPGHTLPPTTPAHPARSHSPAPDFVGSVSRNSSTRRGFVEIDEVQDQWKRSEEKGWDYMYSEAKGARLGGEGFVSGGGGAVGLGAGAGLGGGGGTSAPPLMYGSKRDMWGASSASVWRPAWREGSIFANFDIGTGSPLNAAPAPVPSPASAKRSRNSIFDTPQTVSKPAIKMTEDELAAFRRGDAELSPVSAGGGSAPADPATESMTVPVSLPFTRPPRLPLVGSGPVEGAFLSTNATTRRKWVDLDEDAGKAGTNGDRAGSGAGARKVPINDPAELPPKPASRADDASSESSSPTPEPDQPAPPQSKAITEYLERRRKKEHVEVVTAPAVWDTIRLAFLPTRKNFLGEGRHSEVFLGHYTITTPSTSPISATTPPSRRPEDFRPCAVKRVHHILRAKSMTRMSM